MWEKEVQGLDPAPQTPREQMQMQWDLTSLSGGKITPASKLDLVSQTCSCLQLVLEQMKTEFNPFTTHVLL